MTRRSDYIRIAPSGAKALGSVYGHVTRSGLPGDPSRIAAGAADRSAISVVIELLGYIALWLWTDRRHHPTLRAGDGQSLEAPSSSISYATETRFASDR